MALTWVLSFLALLVSAGASVGPSSNSSLCSESRECLQYELLCQTDEYEVRHYSPTLWVSTDAEAYFMGVGAAMAFRRLFQYITGANEGGYQMDMTAPVLVKIPEETRMWEPAIYTLSFPLPQAYQDKPPQPTNDKLYFTEMPDMDVYVRSYGGWMLSVTSRLQAHQLTKELDRVGASYNHTHHYGVGYDSPLKLLNRHNEVWYLSEGKPVCTDPQEPTPSHPTRRQVDEASEVPHSSRLQADDEASEVPHSSRLQADDEASDVPHSSRLQADDPASEAPNSTKLQVIAPASNDSSAADSVVPSGAPTLLPSSEYPETLSATVNTTCPNCSQTTSTTVSLSPVISSEKSSEDSTPKPSEETTPKPLEESTPKPSEESDPKSSEENEAKSSEESTSSPSAQSTSTEESTQTNSTLPQTTPGSAAIQSADSAPSQAPPSARVPLQLTPSPSEPSRGEGQLEQ